MPNVDEEYIIPIDARQIRQASTEQLAEYLIEQNKLLRKMYSQLAIGINHTYEMELAQQGNFSNTSLGRPLRLFPKLGMFLIIVSGLENGMPQKAVLAAKQTVGTAASFTALATVSGTGSKWNPTPAIDVLIQSVGDQIGICHDGTNSETGLCNVTVIGPYVPEGGG